MTNDQSTGCSNLSDVHHTRTIPGQSTTTTHYILSTEPHNNSSPPEDLHSPAQHCDNWNTARRPLFPPSPVANNNTQQQQQSMKFLLASLAILVSTGNDVATDAFAAPHRRRVICGITTSSSLAASGGRMRVRPIGIGSASPHTRITNVDLESVHDTSDEWIRTRTGISERRVLVHGGTRPAPRTSVDRPEVTTTTTTVDDEAAVPETLRSLGVEAARQALLMSGTPASRIDIVICATSSPDDMFGDAPYIAHAIGCDSGKCVAFDLTAACSGFLFGVVTAGQFLNNGSTTRTEQNALVIGADALTRWVDWEDRNSCILFGDGAGAMVLTSGGGGNDGDGDDDDSSDSEEEDGFGILGYSMHSNGGGYNDLKCNYRGEPKKISTPGDGTIVHDGSYDLMSMNGKKVYAFATREVPTVLEEALVQAGITIDQVDHLLLHQANIRIMETVAERLGISMDKVITNLHKYGNTSAASIPLALDEAVRSGRVKKGDIIACAGFGAGLSWGAAILRWG